MEKEKNNSQSKHYHFLKLAFEQAKINLGSTLKNPSVGCVVEKEGSIISSGYTSLKGRPHAEFNALNKKKNFKNANVYVTLEPCSHYGVTPPCTNIISKKKIKRVYFSAIDIDKRSRNLSKKILNKKKISVYGPLLKEIGLDFYKSYYLSRSLNLPLIDAKVAISNDYYTKNIKSKWITNFHSQKRTHLLRSMYDCIISTSKSINDDNSLLNCRIDGLEEKSPDLVIIDRNLKLKPNLKLFQTLNKRKVILFTCNQNKKKILNFKRKGLKVFFVNNLKNRIDFNNLFLILKKMGYNRILLEVGLIFLNFTLRYRFLNNIYVFKSHKNLKKNGINYTSNKFLKKIKLKNKISVNLFGDKVFKERLK